MKKFIVSLLLLTPLLTGCTNIDSQLTINDDKSASIVTSLTYEGNLLNQGDIVAETVNKNYTKFLDPLYNIETAYSDNLSTVTATKKVQNLSHADLDLSSLGFKTNLPNNRFVEVRKNFLISSINIDMTYNLQNEISKIKKTENKEKLIQSKSGLNPEYLQKYGDPSEFQPAEVDDREDFIDELDSDAQLLGREDIEDANADEKKIKAGKDDDLKVSFSIKVPSFASYNNADNINLNVYSWDISKNRPTNIKLQYVQYSGFAIGFILVIGVVLLVFLAKKILKHDAQKRIDN